MEGEAASLEAYEARLREAMLRGDVAELDALIADDLLFVGPTGEVATKLDDLAAHREGRVRFQRIDIESRETRLMSGAALALVRVRLAAVLDGQPIEGAFRYLRVWRMDPDGWRVVGGQVSALRGAVGLGI